MKRRFLEDFPTLQNLGFWHFQIAGWFLFWCGDAFFIWLQNISSEEIISQALDAPLGFIIALGLRQIYIRIHYKDISILRLLVYILVWSTICTFIWHTLMTTTRYFLINPAYAFDLWETKFTVRWLSLTMPIWFGWSSLYFGIKYWKDLDAEKKRAKQAISLAHRAQLQMLRYQVNPHFLFNALNSVRALIDEDKKNAKVMITELSEFLRYSLVTRDHGEVTLAHELEAIRHYLSIEKKRFEENLEITFDIDKQALDVPLLSFLIHPFVENAVKYGMKTSPMPLRIRIRATVAEDTLEVVISNTGTWLKGLPGDEHSCHGTGTGLENVRARLENAYKNNYRLHTRELDGWVEAALEIHRPTGER